jgi:hypothetical protein
MLFAYYVILAFPLTIVVPFSAFRSLAAEREDNTYDLLSITTLKPRHIISGKLGSAIAQMAVYLSAVTPCLAFTYLLRGVDAPMIAVLLAFTILGSLGLSMFGLGLATICHQRYAQVFVSVAFVAGLVGVFWGVIWEDGLALEFIQHSYQYLGDRWFWIGSLAWLTMYLTTFALAFFAAAGMITFTSENRSTPLRIGMLLQQAAGLSWIAGIWISKNYDIMAVLVMSALAGAYWFVMGSLLTSERPKMSQRMRRSLPQSFLGRVFLTWFNPGPASGYMFVVANATAILLLMLVAVAIGVKAGAVNPWSPKPERTVQVIIVGWGYLVAYLGLGLLIISAVRRVAKVTMIASILIQFLLVFAGSALPWTIQMMSAELRDMGYTFLQITNPFAAFYFTLEGGISQPQMVKLISTVMAAAACVLLLNLPGVISELCQVRIAPPPRVAEDERQLHPPPPLQPTSPWEENG